MNVFSSMTSMSSREIAKLTGKQHSHVKRDCENMFVGLEMDAKEYIQNWIDPQNGQIYTEYCLPKILIETLITGYSYKLRYWVLQRLHDLENKNYFLREQLDALLIQYKTLDSNLSDAGRLLSIGGKQIKPLYQLQIQSILQYLQPDLFMDQQIEVEK